jgi:hypothetical protein
MQCFGHSVQQTLSGTLVTSQPIKKLYAIYNFQRPSTMFVRILHWPQSLDSVANLYSHTLFAYDSL